MLANPFRIEESRVLSRLSSCESEIVSTIGVSRLSLFPYRFLSVTRYATRLSISAPEAVVAGKALPAGGDWISFFSSFAVLRLPIPSSGKLVFL